MSFLHFPDAYSFFFKAPIVCSYSGIFHLLLHEKNPRPFPPLFTFYDSGYLRAIMEGKITIIYVKIKDSNIKYTTFIRRLHMHISV